jgi:hypothetical protein
MSILRFTCDQVVILNFVLHNWGNILAQFFFVTQAHLHLLFKNYSLFLSPANLVHKSFHLRNLKGLRTRFNFFKIFGQLCFVGPNIL